MGSRGERRREAGSSLIAGREGSECSVECFGCIYPKEYVESYWGNRHRWRLECRIQGGFSLLHMTVGSNTRRVSQVDSPSQMVTNRMLGMFACSPFLANVRSKMGRFLWGFFSRCEGPGKRRRCLGFSYRRTILTCTLQNLGLGRLIVGYMILQKTIDY